MIGVVARTRLDAQELIDMLGLSDARAVANRSSAMRGMTLDAVVIDASSHPVNADVMHTARLVTGGNVYVLAHV